jgi:hypothetical protein
VLILLDRSESSPAQPLKHSFNPAVFNRCAAANGVTLRVPRCSVGVWGKVEKEREKMNKKYMKSVINIIFKNNTVITILAVELSNTILLLVL